MCIKCGGVYHRSCLERKQKIPSDDARVQCCSQGSAVESTSVQTVTSMETQINAQNYEFQAMKIENSFLLQLLKQADEKNKILEENIKLLCENKKLLEEKIGLSYTHDKVEAGPDNCELVSDSLSVDLNGDKHLQKRLSFADMLSKQSSNVNNKHENIVNKVSRSNKVFRNEKSESKDGFESTAYNELKKMQKSKMTEIINLEDNEDTKSRTSKGANDPENDGFQKVVNKRRTRTRRIPEIKFATGNNSKQTGKISGAIRRKWIYVGRILGNEVSEDDIKEYLSDLKDYDRFEHITVEKLKTLGRNSAFCIGLPTEELYNKIFSVEYWSEGVALRDYDLRSSFLAQRRQMKSFHTPVQ